jgi:translation elongation factor EF-G
LECLKREDPSLRVSINDEENLGQTTIQGMGELHLDIIKDRILKEYKLKVFFGPLNIAYKEMPTKEITKVINYEKSINEKKNIIQMELSIIPCKDYEFKSVDLIKKGDTQLISSGFESSGMRSAADFIKEEEEETRIPGKSSWKI